MWVIEDLTTANDFACDHFLRYETIMQIAGREIFLVRLAPTEPTVKIALKNSNRVIQMLLATSNHYRWKANK